MHCPICDREDDSISFDRKTGKYSDCQVCEAVIAECLDEFEDIEDEEG